MYYTTETIMRACTCLLILFTGTGFATTQGNSSAYYPLNVSYEILDNGCYVGEEYDEHEDSCYFDCTELSDEECDIAYDSFYSDLDSFIGSDFHGHDKVDHDTADAREIAKYEVDSKLTITETNNKEPEQQDLYREIWSVIVRILPSEFLSQHVVEYHVSTDGKDNTLAFVMLNDNEAEKWSFAIDPADYSDANNKDFIHTIIHEFAHIAFLNNTQVNHDEFEHCDNYRISEGCTSGTSYINQFYERFWSDIIHDNLSALADGDATSEDDIYEFYEKYQAHFVSDYAATNPVEDAAEVFVHFVLKETPTKPERIADNKIAFLHQFPELVKFRKIIRTKLKTRQSL